VKLFAAISRFIHRRKPQISTPPAPFDDGLVDIARLIEVDDPPGLAPSSSTATGAANVVAGETKPAQGGLSITPRGTSL